MLERIDQVDWRSMDAEVVPVVLKGFIQGDKLSFQILTAYERILFMDSMSEPMVLESEIQNHFSDRKVKAVLVPFLIQMLELPGLSTDTKGNLLWDLGFIAGYVDYFGNRRLSSKQYTYADELRALVWEGHNTYATFLDSDDDSEKTASLHLLSQFHEHADIVSPLIHQRLQVESTKWQVEILRMISGLLLRSQSAKLEAQRILQQQLIMFLGQEQQPQLRVASFLALIDMLESETPPTVIEVMLEFFADQTYKWSDVPSYGDISSFVVTPYPITVLLKLGSHKGVTAAISVMDKSPGIHTKFEAMYAALILAFDSSDLDPAYFSVSFRNLPMVSPEYTLESLYVSYSASTNLSNLNASQKEVLATLVKHDWVWEYRTNFQEKFGLPSEREAMRQLL